MSVGGPECVKTRNPWDLTKSSRRGSPLVDWGKPNVKLRPHTLQRLKARAGLTPVSPS
jgi:hypothetical protein